MLTAYVFIINDHKLIIYLDHYVLDKTFKLKYPTDGKSFPIYYLATREIHCLKLHVF